MQTTQIKVTGDGELPGRGSCSKGGSARDMETAIECWDPFHHAMYTCPLQLVTSRIFRLEVR